MLRLSTYNIWLHNYDRYISILNTSSYHFKGCDSITLRTLGVPSYAVKGSDVVLECDYDLEGADLYSVKWYKNGLEFYRYAYLG